MAVTYHPLDLRAQLLHEAVQKRIEWAKGALSGPAPVGAKRLTGQDALKAVMTMTNRELQDRLARGEGGAALEQIMSTLGPNVLPLLPYIQPREDEGMIDDVIAEGFPEEEVI